GGVAGITYLGQRDYSLRAWLDPDRLAALRLGAMDVVTAIAQQNTQVAAGQIGQPPADRAQQFQLTLNTKGRLTDPDEFAAIIIKAAQANPAAQPAAGNSGDTATTDTTASDGQSAASKSTATGLSGTPPQATG